MLTLYFVCLILGGTFLGFSLFSGADSDGGFDHGDVDIHTPDLDTDIQIDSHVHFDHHTAETVDAVRFLSFRNFVYFTSFFGLTGVIMSFIGTTPIWSFISASAIGSFSGFFGHKLMKYLKNNETGQGITLYGLIGKNAVVSVPVRRGGKGRIIINHNGQTIEMAAEIADSVEKDYFKLREHVIILEIINNTAKIIESDL